MSLKKPLLLLSALVALTVLSPAKSFAYWDNYYHGHHYDHGGGRVVVGFGAPIYYDEYPAPAPIYYYPSPAYGQVVQYQPVPQPVLVQLQPPPPGYYYSMGNRQVLVVSNRTHRTAGFISLRF